MSYVHIVPTFLAQRERAKRTRVRATSLDVVGPPLKGREVRLDVEEYRELGARAIMYGYIEGKL